MAMLESHPKTGIKRHNLVVRSEEVDLKQGVFQDYKSQAKSWFQGEHYKNPGPIQFSYDTRQDREIAYSLERNFKEVDDLTAEISGLCNSIQNDALFTEHKHLLVAALSSLKSAKMVINSFARTQ